MGTDGCMPGRGLQGCRVDTGMGGEYHKVLPSWARCSVDFSQRQTDWAEGHLPDVVPAAVTTSRREVYQRRAL